MSRVGRSRSALGGRARRVRGSGATAIVVLMLLAGCGRPPEDATPGSSASPSVSASATPATSATPAPPDEDASFTFDDIASYQGGVEVEITGILARRVTTGMTGAEGTRGEMVVVSVLLRNLSAEDLDATTVLVTAAYGPNDLEAPLVTDPTGGLANGFLGVVTPSAEDTADYGFAIPFTALQQVRVTVDLGDGIHEPVSFFGAVEREQ